MTDMLLVLFQNALLTLVAVLLALAILTGLRRRAARAEPPLLAPLLALLWRVAEIALWVSLLLGLATAFAYGLLRSIDDTQALRERADVADYCRAHPHACDDPAAQRRARGAP